QMDDFTLPTVAEKRKKHMPWIHKQAAEKAEDEGNRAFSQLSAEYATDMVRKKAVEGFDRSSTRVMSNNIFASIVRHPAFERMSLAIIYMNALWIAVDIEFNDADMVLQAHAFFIIVEILFLLYFTSELLIRFMSYDRSRSALTDSWFIFDFLLVLLMVLETWLIPLAALLMQGSESSNQAGMARSASVLRVARILRVLRTARIIRVARYMPELMILVKGLIVAARSVFFTLVLLLLITYVFSIAFAQLSHDTRLKPLYFQSVPTAVLTLIVTCVMPDQESFFQDVAQESWVMGMLVIIFVTIGSLIVMNMLVGILVEAVQTVATMEHEQIHVDFAKRVLRDLIQEGGVDEDGDNQISEEEFCRLLQRPEAMKALGRLGVDDYAVMEYGRLLFEDGEPLTFKEFMDAILTLRGSNQTTVKDIVNLRKFTADEFSHLHTVLMELCKFVAGQGMAKRLEVKAAKAARRVDEV
ncbi:unnamed protein product, partial [Effrenium voratum]